MKYLNLLKMRQIWKIPNNTRGSLKDTERLKLVISKVGKMSHIQFRLIRMPFGDVNMEASIYSDDVICARGFG